MGGGFSQSECLTPRQSVSEGVSASEDLFSGSDPEIIVVSEGDASPPVPPQIVLDDRFNQLDELDSQSSQSILPNCGPSAVSSGGESVCSQIVNSSVPSQSILPNCGPGAVSSGGESASSQIINSSASDNSIPLNCGLGAASSGGESGSSSQTNSSSIFNVSNVSGRNNQTTLSRDGNVNCYSSTVHSDSTPPGPPSVVDSEMAQALDPRKRPSSDNVLKSKGGGKKVSRKAFAISHIPTSLASAARLTRSTKK